MCESKPCEGPAGVRNYPTPRIIPTEYFGFGRPRAVVLNFHGAPGQFKDWPAAIALSFRGPGLLRVCRW